MPIRRSRRRRGPAAVPIIDAWAVLSEGERARLWRLQAGWTQSEIAALTGHSVREVRAVEAGRARASAVQAYRMACAAVVAGVRFTWGPAIVDPAPGMSVEVRARR